MNASKHMNSSQKKSLIIILKLLLTIVLLYLVIGLVDFNEFLSIISKADIRLLLLALALHFLAFAIMSIRWWLILTTSGTDIRYGDIFSAYYFGLFCNNFLPTSMGGDVVRIAVLRRMGVKTGELIFSTVTDRVIGLISILMMGIIGVNFSSSISAALDHQSLILVNSLSAITITLFLLGLNTNFRTNLLRLIGPIAQPITIINNFIIYCHDSLELLKRNIIIYKAIFLSIVSQLLVVGTYFTIAASINVEVSFLEFVLIVPIVFLFASLPISVGGLGVREGILVVLLNAIGINNPNAVSISLLYLPILIIVTLPGSLFLAASQKPFFNLSSPIKRPAGFFRPNSNKD